MNDSLLTSRKLWREGPLWHGAMIMALIVLGLMTLLGFNLLGHSIYDSYTLIAQAWRKGLLHLEQNYSHLELAIFNDNYYVSFPSVPALVMLPLTFIFGENTPNTIVDFSYLLGNVKSVKASMNNFTLEDTIEVEDTLAAVLELESGVRGIFFATNGYTENSTPFFEVSFENGVARYTDKQLWVNGELLAEDTAPVSGKAYWGNGHPGLFKRYYDENLYFTVADAKNTMDTLFAIYEKAGN